MSTTDKPEARQERVTVVQDSRGAMLAQVLFTAPGYGPAYMEANMERIRAKARRAIRNEYATRGVNMTGYRVRVGVLDHDLDAQNRMHSIIFMEVTA